MGVERKGREMKIDVSAGFTSERAGKGGPSVRELVMPGLGDRHRRGGEQDTEFECRCDRSLQKWERE